MTEFWFIGGSRAFLHERGGFLDPPVHYDCGRYALIICPYLAARRFTDRSLVERLRADFGPGVGFANQYEGRLHYPGLPERFGFGMTGKYRVHNPNSPAMIFTIDDWEYLEWWRAGERINAPETGDPPV